MTATMRAVLLRAAGGPEQLVCERVAAPSPGPGEALVRVYAAAITRDELEWPVDRLPAIPSYEVSGVVEPSALSHAEAAAVPLAALSAWQGLFDHGGLREAERVLIHGATGGVGQFATPLAHSHGAHVTATASTRDVERARELGADIIVDHTAAKWDADLAPVDLVFDTAGGQRLAGSPGVLRDGGRLVSVAVYPLEDASSAFERSLRPDKRGKVVLDAGPGGCAGWQEHTRAGASSRRVTGAPSSGPQSAPATRAG
jgi:NADPH:quinone reductase-like Zn-dependent oxidoreductase